MARTRRKATVAQTPTDIVLTKSDVARLAGTSRLMINIIATVLALAFAFLVLGQSQIVTILNESDPGVLYKLGLALYYTAWVFGTKFDVDIDERVYIKDTARGLLDWKAFGIIMLLTAVMALFFWLHQYERVFGFGLIAFVLVNVAAWRITCRRISVPIQDSKEEYVRLNDHFGAEKVRIVERFMCGDWQKRRLATMLGLAIVMVLLIYAIPFFGLASRVGNEPIHGVPAAQLVKLAPAIFFLGYVVVAEAWIWIKRINAYHCVNVLDQLAVGYRLVPRAPRATQ